MKVLAAWLMATAGTPAVAQRPTHAIDHLILGVASLDSGVAEFERLTGVAPVRGGKHPGAGTENALVSLGPGVYLEILAPQPGVTPTGPWAGLGALNRLSPVGWAVRSGSIPASQAALRERGFATGEARAGSRLKPDGTTLAWTTAGILRPLSSATPFLIQWTGETVHPSTSSPAGCRFESWEMADPAAPQLDSLTTALQIRAGVRPGPETGMTLVIDCPRGRITFASM